MKNRVRVLAVLMSLAMLLGVFALAISAAADEPEVIVLNKGETEIGEVRVRFESTKNDSKAEVIDGKLTLTANHGDWFWFPSVKLSETSVISATLTKLEGAGATGFFGVAYGVTMNTSGIQGTGVHISTDSRFRTAAFNARSTANGYYITSSYNPDSLDLKGKDGLWENKGHAQGGTSAWGSYFDRDTYGAKWNWVNATEGAANSVVTIESKVVTKEDEEKYVESRLYLGSGEEKVLMAVSYNKLCDDYVLSNNFKDSVGFFHPWGSKFKIRVDSFTVSDVYINESTTPETFDLNELLKSASIPPLAVNASSEFDGNDAIVTARLTTDASILENDELVVVHNELEIFRGALSSLEKDGSGYLYTNTELTVESTADLLVFRLERNGEAIEKTTQTYSLGAAYQAYLDSLGEPVASSQLNTVSYAEDFEGLNMTLIPGENLVNGQKWLYIKNSEDGSAVIRDGKLYFSGSDYDRILFVDQLYDHINFRYLLDVCYDSVPEVPVTENEETTGAYGYIGAAVNVPLELIDEKQNIGIAAFTPDYLFLKHAYFDGDGILHMQDEKGDLAVMPNDQRPSGAWSQYWQAVKPGEPFMMRVFSGISDVANGNFGAIYADPATGSTKGGWGNNYSMSKSYRTGVIGLIAGEGQASATVDNIRVEIVGTKIRIDNADFYIWGDGKVAVSALERSGEKLIYATVDGALKYAGDTVTANRKTKITTSQVTLSTRKTVAEGETGLKWRTEISKADYDRLAADENIKSIQLGTVVVPTSAVAGGLTKEAVSALGASASDLVAASEWTATSDTVYTFEGVRTIAKADRDTSYSGVGYLQVTMADDTVITVYADYVTRNHAYALSDLVSEFHDPEDEPASASDQQGTTPAGNDPAVQNETTPEQSGKKKGCGGTIGTSAFFLLIALSGMCIVIRKKKERERS